LISRKFIYDVLVHGTGPFWTKFLESFLEIGSGNLISQKTVLVFHLQDFFKEISFPIFLLLGLSLEIGFWKSQFLGDHKDPTFAVATFKVILISTSLGSFFLS